jgi:hypothetical protein
MGVLRGVVLGAANVLVIAIGMSIAARDGDVTVLVVLYGGIPGLVTGALLGGIAQGIAAQPPQLRAPVLAVPAIGVVLFLASAFDMLPMAPVACIPTVVAALILERWTRRVAPAPVPVATAISTGT